MEAAELNIVVYDPILSKDLSKIELKGGDEDTSFDLLMKSAAVLDDINISIYKCDTVNIVREKIYLLTDIPIYRQHLLFKINNKYVPTYNITVGYENAPFNIMTDLSNQSTDMISNIVVDRSMISNKNDIKINSLELNMMVNNTTEILVVDLFTIVNPSDSNITNIISDTYYKDVIYYGVIYKYFPILCYDAFELIYVKNESIDISFPQLDINKYNIIKKYNNEKICMTNILSNMKKSEEYIKSQTNRLVYSVKSLVLTCQIPNINMRNLFDMLELNDTIILIACKIYINSQLYVLVKKHIKYSNLNIDKNAIKINTLHIRESTGTRIIISKTRFTFEMKFNESDRYSYDETFKIASDLMKNYLNTLSKYSLYIMTDSLFTKTFNIQILSSDVIMVYPRTLDTAVFVRMGEFYKQYADAGIITVQSIKHDKYTIILNKGIYGNALNIGNINQFDYYTSAEMMYKTILSIRNDIQISHVSSGILFEFVQFSNNDFHKVYPFLLSLTHLFVDTFKINTTMRDNVSKKVKRLSEIDPNMFDFKKYDSEYDVYSVRCQSDRQPSIYREAEYNTLQNNIKKSSVKFWNFSENNYVYYHCPSSKYPVLSFKPQLHPRGYCVPCCKKNNPSSESTSNKINKLCMEKYKLTDDEISKILTDENEHNHIFSYGKSIVPGRYSKLFTDVLDDKNLYYLNGVEQHVPSYDNAGFVYSIIDALNLKMSTFIDELKKYIHLIKEYTDDLNDLIDAIFVKNMDIMMNINWIPIIKKLTKLAYDVDIIYIDDVDSMRNIVISKTLEISLHSNSCKKIIIIIAHSNGIYPVYMGHPPVKKVFSSHDTIIKSIVKTLFSSDNNIRVYIELNDMLKFLNDDNKYTLTNIFLSKFNMIYACILKKDNKNIYVPLLYISDTDIAHVKKHKTYIPKDIINTCSRCDALTFLKDFNAVFNYSFKPVYNLGTTGFGVSTDYRNYGYVNIFYHKPELTPLPDIPSVDIPYDVHDINTVISKNNHTTKYGDYEKYLYKNYMYRLFIAEFAYILRKNKNVELRTKIRSIISKSTVAYSQLSELLKDYPNDHTYILYVLQSDVKSVILNIFDYTYFDFDKKLLKSLQLLNEANRIKKLHELLSDRIAIVDNEPILMSNTYVSCEENTNMKQCASNKLKMSTAGFESCLKILSEDVMLPLRCNMIFTMIHGTVNPLKFIERPLEIISITML